MATDSTGKPIRPGDRVLFRGREYTITRLRPREGRYGTCGIDFDMVPHTDEPADEVNVDLVSRGQ